MTNSEPTILVVDDDDDVRDTVVEALQDEGFSAAGAAGGRAALELLRRAQPKPDVILLDLMMPGMSGIEFRAEQLRDPSLASIPVILLSASANIETVAVELETRSFLKKPVRLEALLVAVRSAGAGRP